MTVFRAALRVGTILAITATALGCSRVLDPTPPPASGLPSVEPASASHVVVISTDGPPSPTLAPPTPPGDAELVLHLTTASDVGASGPGTTILEDRRIIWGDDHGRPLMSRLTPDGLSRVLAELEATDAFDAPGDYFPELRPGKQPPGHGFEFSVFTLVREGETIGVSAADPSAFIQEQDIWVLPPEMRVLTQLAHRLGDPVTWLGPDAFAEPVQPYVGTVFLVEIHLYRGIGGSIPNVDDVRWPFGEPIERVGEQFEAGGDPESRCLFIDAATASATVAAEARAGVERDLRDWASSLDYEWPRVGGFVTVTLVHLLPFESGTCAELSTRFR